MSTIPETAIAATLTGFLVSHEERIASDNGPIALRTEAGATIAEVGGVEYEVTLVVHSRAPVTFGALPAAVGDSTEKIVPLVDTLWRSAMAVDHLDAMLVAVLVAALLQALSAGRVDRGAAQRFVLLVAEWRPRK